MNDLTPRQIEILKAVIVEYTESGEAVGSQILDKKYNLGVSPATVRSEMVELTKKGLLKKEHFSSGRVPTSTAFRFYISNLMKEKELSTAEEISYKNDIWDFKEELHQLLQQATRILAKRTNLLALTTTNSGDVYYFGIPNLLSQKEFFDFDLSRMFFRQLDDFSFWKSILDQFRKIEDEIVFMWGDDNQESCVSVFGEFEGNKVKGAMGVMGSNRMAYERIVPNIKYFTNLVGEIIKGKGL